MSVGMSKRSERGSQIPLNSEAGSTFVMNAIDSLSSARMIPAEMRIASSAAAKKSRRRMRCVRARPGATCRSSRRIGLPVAVIARCQLPVGDVGPRG